ncbi:MAG: glycosyltransferase family 2 protein [Deltaproteobacteria bacterium]|nr:glycosyltransferase family 2 protein [Candidatus Deferrimicrobiaceae bacterium]
MNPDFSVIVPLYNEEESVEPLYRAIVNALDPLGKSYELLFIDDGSRDATFAKAKRIAEADPRLRVVRFRKNYGQTPAMVAGIEHAKGRVLVTMDGDLQNDPADIPRFLEKIDEGNDIVCGWRHKRQDKLITRKIPSVIANWIIGKITKVPIKDNGCSLKAYRADIIKSIPLYSDMHRFIPAMTSMAGTSVAELKVNHSARKFGVSKYGISRIYKVIIDLLVIKTLLAFGSKPMHLFAAAGLTSLLLGGAVLFGAAGGMYRTGRVDFMLASGGLLFLILSFFLLLVGFLCELINKTGSFRTLAHLKKTVE